MTIVSDIFNGKDQDHFAIILSTFEKAFCIPLNIYDDTGKLVKKAEVKNQRIDKPLEFHKKGPYIVQLEQDAPLAASPSPKLGHVNSYFPKKLSKRKTKINDGKEEEETPLTHKRRKLFSVTDSFIE